MRADEHTGLPGGAEIGIHIIPGRARRNWDTFDIIAQLLEVAFKEDTNLFLLLTSAYNGHE